MNVFEIIGYALMSIGIGFSFVSVIGLIKIDNVYNQLHAASINDMFALPVTLLGVCFYMISIAMYSCAVKVFLLIILSYLINPLNSYAIVKTVYFYTKKNTK